MRVERGFEILWRETTDSGWAIYDFVAAAQESVLKGVSTDNHFFAVRAVGRMARGRSLCRQMPDEDCRQGCDMS